MWLIETSSYQLKSFVGKNRTPKYAILSHRWKSDEITFQEIQDEEFMLSTGYTLKGWRKIKSFCDLIRPRGIHYAWVDTCCIDKSSSAELSESINSMFQWYKNSQVCIAYLSDVTDKADFIVSEWFDRGWTLQELLAPTSVEFVDKNWNFLCTRKEKAYWVSERTKIPVAIVYDQEAYPVSSCSIAQRMSWASNRKTTRPEDIVYCLLGIFGVNLPLLYGEGEGNAFRRLQSEILSSSDDESIFAWSAQPIGELAFTRTATRPDPVLAPGIRSFSFASRIRRSDKQRNRMAYSMTNRGLRARLTLFQANASMDERNKNKTNSNRLLAPLDCSLYGTSLCLALEKADFAEETYARRGICLLPSNLGQGEVKEIIITSRPIAPENPPGLPRKQLLKYKHERVIGKIKIELASGDILSPWSRMTNSKNAPDLSILDFLREDFKSFMSKVQDGATEQLILILKSWPFPEELVQQYTTICREVEDYTREYTSD